MTIETLAEICEVAYLDDGLIVEKLGPFWTLKHECGKVWTPKYFRSLSDVLEDAYAWAKRK